MNTTKHKSRNTSQIHRHFEFTWFFLLIVLFCLNSSVSYATCATNDFKCQFQETLDQKKREQEEAAAERRAQAELREQQRDRLREQQQQEAQRRQDQIDEKRRLLLEQATERKREQEKIDIQLQRVQSQQNLQRPSPAYAPANNQQINNQSNYQPQNNQQQNSRQSVSVPNPATQNGTVHYINPAQGNVNLSNQTNQQSTTQSSYLSNTQTNKPVTSQTQPTSQAQLLNQLRNKPSQNISADISLTTHPLVTNLPPTQQTIVPVYPIPTGSVTPTPANPPTTARPLVTGIIPFQQQLAQPQKSQAQLLQMLRENSAHPSAAANSQTPTQISTTNQISNQAVSASAQQPAAVIIDTKNSNLAATPNTVNEPNKGDSLTTTSTATSLSSMSSSAASSTNSASAQPTAARAQSNVEWTSADNGSDITWYNAINYCKRKGAGWRLPTSDELRGLYNADEYQSCGTASCGVPSNIRVTEQLFWTGERADNGDAAYALIVSLANGKEVGNGNSYNSVRTEADLSRALCVRDGGSQVEQNSRNNELIKQQQAINQQKADAAAAAQRAAAQKLVDAAAQRSAAQAQSNINNQAAGSARTNYSVNNQATQSNSASTQNSRPSNANGNSININNSTSTSTMSPPSQGAQAQSVASSGTQSRPLESCKIPQRVVKQFSLETRDYDLKPDADNCAFLTQKAQYVQRLLGCPNGETSSIFVRVDACTCKVYPKNWMGAAYKMCTINYTMQVPVDTPTGPTDAVTK